MAGSLHRGRKVLGGTVLALLLTAAAVAWTERGPLLAWFFVRGLTRADDNNRDLWVTRVARLGEAVVPDLLDTLADPDPAVCSNSRAALSYLSSEWPADDVRRASLVGRLARGWDNFSTAGKLCALEVTAGWFRNQAKSTPDLVSASAGLLAASSHDETAEVQSHALELCSALLRRPGGERAISPGRGIVRACLGHADASMRVLAVRLALHPGMDLLEDVVPLLNDPAVPVRRAAIMAVGPAEQVVRDEGLLPCLHDTDPEVRQLSEMALRGRGLRPEHIKLGRILTDPSPVVRLQVLDQLRRTPDLDAGIWLRRLSHDTSPAVRAAAMRAMSQQSVVDLTDRIDQMARNDPSPTVCMLARYYLKNTHPPSTEP
jgi:hypothetical protein